MKYFTIAELIRSETTTRKGINNQPSAGVKANLEALVEHVLDPVREHFGKPVIVTSGYRSTRLNKAIGGSSTSDHCSGCAADFTVVGHSNREVCEWIRDNLDFKQLIYEFGESGWVHCSFKSEHNGKSVLSASRNRAGRTVYSVGLPD